ncbi:MAG: 5-deoxyglucuronate isomerase, partial [Herbinix sp.]|nr:5-deoxyglucuronate isomerase [Herbinix sp.]
MLNYLAFNAEGKKAVSRVDGINKDMLMDITVFQMKKGKTYVFYEEDKEIALLLLGGSVEYRWESRIDRAAREDVFTQAPYC